MNFRLTWFDFKWGWPLLIVLWVGEAFGLWKSPAKIWGWYLASDLPTY